MKTKVIWLVFILLIALTTGVIWSINRKNVSSVKFEQYRNVDLGLGFAYRVSPDGYVLVKDKIAELNDPTALEYMTLFNAKEYQEFASSTVPREGPPGIAIMVFRNDKNEQADVWLKNHSFVANYREGENRLDRIELAGTNGVTYMADGLYQNQVVVLQNKSNIYLFSGAYNSPEDQLRRDFLEFIKTINLF